MSKVPSNSIPYFAVLIPTCVAFLLSKFDASGEIYPHTGTARLLREACDQSIPWAIGFALLSAVFFSWRPQTRLQILTGLHLLLLFFAIQTLHNEYFWLSPGSFLRSSRLHESLFRTSLAMVVTLPLPVLLRFFTRFQLRQDSGNTRANVGQGSPGFAILDLLMLTFCCALFAAAAANPSIALQEKFSPMSLRVASIALTASVGFHLALFSMGASGFKKAWLTVLCIAVVLACAMSQPMIDPGIFPRGMAFCCLAHYATFLAIQFTLVFIATFPTTSLLSHFGFRFVSPRD